MSNQKLGRRQFLWLAISRPVSLSTVLTIGCDSGKHKAVFLAPELSPEESLKKLVLLLGPWPPAEREKAEDFAGRFLKAEHAVTPYLPGLSRPVQNLARRFPANTVAAEQINLRKLPAKEQELLLNLTKQLYSFIHQHCCKIYDNQTHCNFFMSF